MSSMSSASSLPRNPMVAKARVSAPASGPNPTITTKKIAMTISWNERDMAMNARQARYTGAGEMLRAAPNANGTESTMPRAVAATVIARLSSMPMRMNSQRDAKSGVRKPRNRVRARSSPCATRCQSTSTEAPAAIRYPRARRGTAYRR